MMMTMGERLKLLIEQRGISQKELAKKAGCTDAAISHYIKGDRVPRASVLTKIAIALDTTSEFLMEGIPADVTNELGFAKRLIARNVSQMSNAEKKRDY